MSGRSISSLSRKNIYAVLSRSTSVLTLPNKEFSGTNSQWLMKYGLTSQEIEENGIYCGELCSIVFPCYLNDKCVGFQVRHSKEETERTKRKYTIQGDKLQMSMSTLQNRSGRTLVFVEDLVSCIKVSRHCPCICLFGSHLPIELVLEYLEGFKSFRLWLDPDKKKESVLQCFKLKQKGINIRAVINCDVDPKDCSDERIKEILDELDRV